MELSSPLCIHCRPACVYSSYITYPIFAFFTPPGSCSSLLASPGMSTAILPADSVPRPGSATGAPYPTASDFILPLGIWRWLRSLRMCILWSLLSWQAIKGKVITWTEAHGKVTPGSFLLASILDWRDSTLTLYTLYFLVSFLNFRCFFISSLLLLPVTVMAGLHQRFGYWFIVSVYTPCPWHELQARGIIKECLRLLQSAFRSVCIAMGSTCSSQRHQDECEHPPLPTQTAQSGWGAGKQDDGEGPGWFVAPGRVVAAAEICLAKLGSASELEYSQNLEWFGLKKTSISSISKPPAMSRDPCKRLKC